MCLRKPDIEADTRIKTASRGDRAKVEEAPMDDKLRNWHPSPAEVKAIVRELRPLISEFARRDAESIAVERSRRMHPSQGRPVPMLTLVRA